MKKKESIFWLKYNFQGQDFDYPLDVRLYRLELLAYARSCVKNIPLSYYLRVYKKELKPYTDEEQIYDYLCTKWVDIFIDNPSAENTLSFGMFLEGFCWYDAFLEFLAKDDDEDDEE